MRTRPVMLAVVALAATAFVQAASAGGSSITVPNAGPKTVSTSWTGTYPMGTNATTFTAGGNCKDDLASFTSAHPFQVSVPARAYNLVKAKMLVQVDSAPALDGDFMELVDPSGNSYGKDQQKATMEVDVVDPKPGTWTVLTCEFVPDSPGDHSYTGTVTIKTTCKATSPCAPARKPR